MAIIRIKNIGFFITYFLVVNTGIEPASESNLRGTTPLIDLFKLITLEYL